MSLFDPNSPSGRAYDLKHRSPEVRAQTLRPLQTLIERYPNMRLGQLIANAISGRDLFNIEDDELGLALNHLFVTFTQFESAGIMERKKR
jgi:hypothetical protein